MGSQPYDPMTDADVPKILIPVPTVAPLGQPLDHAEDVQIVWDTFVKPGQDRGDLQSVEDRYLIAILRAVYAGLASPTRAGGQP